MKARRTIRRVRRRLTSEKGQEKAAYEATASIGSDSSNVWIRRSASIPGWLFPGEHELLWDLATRPGTGNVLEIGTWMGKSACILAGACAETAPDSKVYCVDPFDMRGTPDQEAYHRRLVRERGTFYQFLENAGRAGFDRWVIPVAAVAADAVPHLPDGLRMAFVDGAHDYESVKRDAYLALGKLSIGGVIAIHDARNEVWPDIARFVDEDLSADQRIREIEGAGTVVAFEKVRPTS